MKRRETMEGFERIADHDAFMKGDELHGITHILSLPERTCTMRAAQTYLETRQGNEEHAIDIRTIDSFRAAIDAILRDQRSAMLIPEQHELQAELAVDPRVEEIVSQRFVLPNPGLHVATPERNASDRTYLWTLPALLPLVEERYDGELPFEEIVPVRSTQEAALECGKIYGGAFCVTNDQGLEAYRLRSVQRLRDIAMRWFLYRKTRSA